LGAESGPKRTNRSGIVRSRRPLSPFPLAAKGDPSLAARGRTVVVTCSIDGVLLVLRTSMSGYARIYTGRRSLGGILVNRVMRLFRTEFWW
jgi:hypothetical protein